MARALRIEQAGVWHHVTALLGKPVYELPYERDRAHFKDVMVETMERFELLLHAWVLMDNHYHLLVEAPGLNLSRAMQWLNVSYSVWFNRRHDRAGHLFQGRFKAIVVEPESWGLELSRYLHLNPVRTGRFGLDKNARKRQREGLDAAPKKEEIHERLKYLRGYGWSSYRAYVGVEAAPSWLKCAAVLDFIGNGSLRRQRLAYHQYVANAVREGLQQSPWEELAGQVLLGGAEFLEQMQSRLVGNAKEQPSLRQLRKRVGWEQMVAAGKEVKGGLGSSFRDRHRDWGRDLALYLARRHCGLGLNELGEVVGGLDYRTVSWAVSRFGRRLTQDRRLAALTKKLTRQIQNPEI